MANALLTKFQQQCLSYLEDVNDVTCPICLEIYDEPRKISCGHIFCKGCLANYDDIVTPACPVCRQTFEVMETKKASKIIKTINSSTAACRGCMLRVPLSKLRYHNSVCPQLIDKPKDVPNDSSNGASGGQAAAAMAPNRCTFRCPFCGVQNLDTHALLKHCNTDHATDTAKVVCPICAAMPWGDTHLKSSDFIAHLNLRHKFEYGFVVDFSLNDDEALEKALKASIDEQ